MSSSDKARPPKTRRRIGRIVSSEVKLSTSASREEEVSASSRGGAPIMDPGRQDNNEPVATRKDPPPSSRGHRGARGGRGRGSTVSTSEDEEVVVPHIDNDLLIQLVEARPALWDPTVRHHADHQHTQRLWEEVSVALFLTWEDLSRAARHQSIKKVQIRWRSMRDRFKKDYIKARAPSGSRAPSRPQYRYHAALGFLRQTLALRSASSTQESEAVPEPTSSPSDHTTAGPLPGPSGDRPRDQILSTFWPISSHLRNGRSSQGPFEDFLMSVYDCLQGFTEEIRAIRADMMRYRESSHQLSPHRHFALSLVPIMDQMTPEQLHEFKLQLENEYWRILNRPPSQSYSHLSSLPEQPPSFSSTPPPHFVPSASFPTPTYAWESSSPSNTSSLHNPQIPPASLPRAREGFSGGLSENRGANIAGSRASSPPRQFHHL